jgi:hypothetical protein
MIAKISPKIRGSFSRIDASPENDKFPPEELSRKIREHGDELHEPVIPSDARQSVSPPGGGGDEKCVKQSDLQHGDRNVIRGLESEAAV